MIDMQNCRTQMNSAFREAEGHRRKIMCEHRKSTKLVQNCQRIIFGSVVHGIGPARTQLAGQGGWEETEN